MGAMTPPNLLEQMMLSLMLLGSPGAQTHTPAATPTVCTPEAACTPCDIATVCAPAALPAQPLRLNAKHTACTRLLQRQARFEQLAQEGGNSRKIAHLSKQSRAVQEHAQRMGCTP